ncbi:MAG: 30S ribosomal protein S24e [Candidatus Bathyarchaeota archaeon]|nr:30S ribosomal protein S24e [Candidatus Bathyarchaeum sp.]
MKLKIVSKEKNPLLKRTEVTFSIEHDQTGGTPSRAEVRSQIAAQLNTKLELVYIKNLETRTGTMVALGEANAYDSAEQAKLVEPKHIIARNAVPEEPEEPETPESQEETLEESATEEEES